MSDAACVEELLELWEEARQQGCPQAPEDLCRGRPELLAELKLRILLQCWEETREQGGPRSPEELCEDCPGLLAELQRRVQALQGADQALALPATEVAPAARADASSEDRQRWPAVPGYVILSELGHGGQGRVYKAREISLDRVVALKMLWDRLPNPGQLDRFRREAQALARLNHPHVVQIYASSVTADGCAVLALEFVEGGGLDMKLGGAPMPAAQAAELAEKLARALHCIHQNGILHRDLKPSNVLLTREGEPKVTDFGLAKLVQGQTGINSHTGEPLGTVCYMPPEQAGGHTEIDAAADIYGLGAILYELLTGRPPFWAASWRETIRQVLEEEPVPPRRLQPKLPRDVETICLKCLEKEPHKRYASAQGLADDLRHFLAGEPIVARPLGALERLGRWVRRHPLEMALSVVSALAVMALAAVVVNGRIQKQVQEERNRAIAARELADDALERIFQLVIEGHLRAHAGLGPVHEELRDYYQRLIQQREENLRFERGEGLQAEQARLAGNYLGLGTLLETIGDKAGALDKYERASNFYGELAAHSGSPGHRDKLAQALLKRGILLHGLGRWEEAEDEYRQSLTGFDGLSQEHPEQLDYQLCRAEVYHNLAILHATRGQHQEALRTHGQALQIRKRLVHEPPGNPLYERDLARSHGYLGDVQLELGRHDQARASYREAEIIREKLRDANPADPEAQFQLARSYWNSGKLNRETNELDQALEVYEKKARNIQKELVRRYPALTMYQSDLGWVSNYIGELYLAKDEPARAIPFLEEAREIFGRLHEDYPQDRSYRRGLAWSHAYLGKGQIVKAPALASASLTQAQQIFEGLRSQQRANADDLYNLAVVCALRGPDYHDKALAMLGQAVQGGYRNLARLESDTAFIPLRAHDKFKEMLSSLREK